MIRNRIHYTSAPVYYRYSQSRAVGSTYAVTGLLPGTKNCGLRMRWECRERFSRHRLQRKPLVSNPGMPYGTCMTHVPWCLLGLLSRYSGKNVSGIPGACTARNYTYFTRDPWRISPNDLFIGYLDAASPRHVSLQSTPREFCKLCMPLVFSCGLVKASLIHIL